MRTTPFAGTFLRLDFRIIFDSFSEFFSWKALTVSGYRYCYSGIPGFSISLLTPFLKLKLISWTLHSASQARSTISTSVQYKDTDTHNFLHYTSSHCKNGIPYSQFLRVRRLCSEDDDFLQKYQEMSTFFESRDFPSDLLRNARESVSSTPCVRALSTFCLTPPSVNALPSNQRTLH